MTSAQAAYRLDVRHRNRLAAAGVIGNGQHHQGNVRGAFAGNQGFERHHIHVAFEVEPELCVGGLGNGQVDGLRAGELNIGPRGVKVCIRRHDLARFADHGKQNVLRGAALVGGKHVPEAGQVIGHAAQAIETLAAGIRLITAHQRRPLFGGHGARTGIREQINEDVAGTDTEQVVSGFAKKALSLLQRGVPEGFDALDAERFDDGLHTGSPQATNSIHARRFGCFLRPRTYPEDHRQPIAELDSLAELLQVQANQQEAGGQEYEAGEGAHEHGAAANFGKLDDVYFEPHRRHR